MLRYSTVAALRCGYPYNVSSKRSLAKMRKPLLLLGPATTTQAATTQISCDDRHLHGSCRLIHTSARGSSSHQWDWKHLLVALGGSATAVLAYFIYHYDNTEASCSGYRLYLRKFISNSCSYYSHGARWSPIVEAASDKASSESNSSAKAVPVGLPMVAGKIVEKKVTREVLPPLPEESKAASQPKKDPKTIKLPDKVEYLIIGAGTAGFSAFRAIRGKDVEARILVIGEEEVYPYMRPPLSKELWFTDDPKVGETLKFKQWNGKERSIFFEPEEFYADLEELDKQEHGYVAVARGRKVVRIDPLKHEAKLADGTRITYGKCLIATGGKPRNLKCLEEAGPEMAKHVTLFRTTKDFHRLEELSRKVKSMVIVGGGFLGSELACALGKRAKDADAKVIQVFPESGNMGRVLPKYLSHWTSDKVRKEGVKVIPGVLVEGAKLVNNQVHLKMSCGNTLVTDHVVVTVGLEPKADIGRASGLEIDPEHGGYRVDAELRARNDVWVAGDCCSFYDIKLGRRRVEHHDHAVVSGRLAGENMTGAGKPFWHQSMFWSDLGPDVGYEAIGIVDSSLPTMGIFAKVDEKSNSGSKDNNAKKSNKASTDVLTGAHAPAPGQDYSKGVIFYLKGKQVIGIVLWNVFNRMPIARKILKEGKEVDDFGELSKLFNLHGAPSGPESS